MGVIISFLLLIACILLELGRLPGISLDCCCGLDIMVNLAGALTFLFIVILPVFIQNFYITKDSFTYQFVIRHKSWRSILLTHIKKAVFFSLANACIFMLIIFIFLFIWNIPLYNWDSYNSLFYIYEGRCLMLNWYEVYLYACACIFVRCMIIQNILLLFSWQFRYRIIGNFIILCIIFDEAVRGDKLICRLIPFNYDIWYNTSARYRMAIQCVIYFCIAALIYKYILSRKEILQCG